MKTSNHLLHKNYEDCCPVQEVEGREMKAESFLGLTGESTVPANDTNNTNFATGSTTKQMIEEIWGPKSTSMHAACN